MVRALRRFDEESFVVKLPEGHQIAVPAWMLDPVFCSQLPQHDQPLIALEALLELAEFIELERLPCLATDSESGPSPRRGGIDGLRTQRKLSPNVRIDVACGKKWKAGREREKGSESTTNGRVSQSGSTKVSESGVAVGGGSGAGVGSIELVSLSMEQALW